MIRIAESHLSLLHPDMSQPRRTRCVGQEIEPVGKFVTMRMGAAVDAVDDIRKVRITVRGGRLVHLHGNRVLFTSTPGMPIGPKMS
jgi:hypothetical protein